MLELDTFSARWISRRTGRGSEGAEEMGGNDDCIPISGMNGIQGPQILERILIICRDKCRLSEPLYTWSWVEVLVGLEWWTLTQDIPISQSAPPRLCTVFKSMIDLITL